MRAAQEDLALGRERDVRVRPCDPDRAELDAVGRHGGGEARVLGLAVDLAHVDAERHEPPDQLGRDRRGAGGGGTRAVQAERALDVVEHEDVGEPKEQPAARPRAAALDPSLRHPHADADRPPIREPTERRRLAHAQGDRRVELLPDPRHREEHGGRHLADVLGHRVDALREVHGRAGEQRVEDAEGPLGDVGERQERELLVAGLGLGQEVGVGKLKEDVAVAQHGPLGRAGGAGRVDEDRQVIRLGDLDHGVEGPGMLAVVGGAELDQLLERHDLRVPEAVQALHVVDEDHGELRTPGAGF